MSIRKKLLLLYFMIAGIPALSVTIYNHFYALDKMAESTEHEMKADLYPSVVAFDEVAKTINDDIDVLAWNYELHSLLSVWYDQEKLKNAAATNTFDQLIGNLSDFVTSHTDHSPLKYLYISYCDTSGAPIMIQDFRKADKVYLFGDDSAKQRQKEMAEKLYVPDPVQRSLFQNLLSSESTTTLVKISKDVLAFAALVLDEDEIEYIGLLVVKYNMQDLLDRSGINETPAEHAVHVALNSQSGELLFQRSRGDYILSITDINQISSLSAESDSVSIGEFFFTGLPDTWAVELRLQPELGINIGILRNITETTHTWRRSSLSSMFALISILCISGILIGLVVKRITKSISAVSDAAQEVAAGNLEQKIEVSSRDELHGLAQSFNTMSVSLRQTMNNLEELNHNLETRVSDRTRDLESANALIEEQKFELETELIKAHDMQMRLMPENAPEVAGFDLAGECRTATHVGGDLFQYFTLPDGRISFFVADVTGHGMEAAVPSIVFCGLLRNQIAYSETPEHLYDELNQSLYSLLDSRTFICVAMGELNVNQRSLQICNSGCPYPYHYKHSTNTVSEIRLDAFPLGLRENASYEVLQTYLESGDRIVLCSDGIVEASNQNGEIFGFERTIEAIYTGCSVNLDAHNLKEHIFKQVNDFSQATERDDDQTLVVLYAKS